MTLVYDGAPITAYAGDTVALALLAAGRSVLCRSAKYHRPRGPLCLRGNCDGCLVRIDGVPNVMACRTTARDGMVVISQNAFPAAGLDVFRVTDWFFPKHLDHHHLMVDFGRALNRTMQVFARKMAGFGTLPDEAGAAVLPVAEVHCDALVVGGGASGASAARVLGDAGMKVYCIDEEPVAEAGCVPNASAVASYDNGTLVLRDGALERVTTGVRVFANGCHEGVGVFAGNDLPGVFTARAVERALRAGVLLGGRVTLAGKSTEADSLARALTEAGAVVEWAPDATVVEAHGSSGVKRVTLREGGTERTVRCDALAIAGEVHSAYELAGQAGAELGWDSGRGCFAPVCDPDGATRVAGVYCAGSLRLGDVPRGSRAADGERVAGRVLRDRARGVP